MWQRSYAPQDCITHYYLPLSFALPRPPPSCAAWPPPCDPALPGGKGRQAAQVGSDASTSKTASHTPLAQCSTDQPDQSAFLKHSWSIAYLCQPEQSFFPTPDLLGAHLCHPKHSFVPSIGADAPARSHLCQPGLLTQLRHLCLRLCHRPDTIYNRRWGQGAAKHHAQSSKHVF